MSVTNINIEELKELIKKGGVEIIDVRESYEHEEYHIKDDKLIPMSLIPLKTNEIDWSKKVVFYCQSGARSGMITRSVDTEDRDIYNLVSGAYSWYASGDREFIEAEI